VSDPGLVRLARALSQHRVMQSVVDLVHILRQSLVQLLERPDCLAFRVHRLSYLAHKPRKLSVSFEIVNELGVGRSEQTLTNRAEARLGWRPGLLRALVSG